jgi:hypothetical protein
MPRGAHIPFRSTLQTNHTECTSVPRLRFFDVPYGHILTICGLKVGSHTGQEWRSHSPVIRRVPFLTGRIREPTNMMSLMFETSRPQGSGKRDGGKTRLVVKCGCCFVGFVLAFG